MSETPDLTQRLEANARHCEQHCSHVDEGLLREAAAELIALRAALVEAQTLGKLRWEIIERLTKQHNEWKARADAAERALREIVEGRRDIYPYDNSERVRSIARAALARIEREM